MSDPLDMFQYLTDLVVENINGSGAEKLIEILLTPDVPVEKANETASVVFTELLMRFEDGNLESDAIVSLLQVAITDDEKAAVFAQVFDVFPLSDRLKDLLTKISESDTIQPATYAQHINCDSVILAGIVPKEALYRQLNSKKRDEFYTQKKFNLLHEEYEGFTMLISEFYNITKNAENEFQVDYAVSMVELMIGHYQLDPNRVLDLILDIFTNVLVGNHRFMINFFKSSRWWPAVESDCTSGLHTLSNGGCDHAAKLIALKIVKYLQDREFAETFKIMTVILIKEGFLSFGSLYNYFSRFEDEMTTLEDQYNKELDEKVTRASASALALAAPLMDDEATNSESTQTNSAPAPTKSLESMLKHNVHFQFLKSCLGNGLYWPSIYILSNYPFLAYMEADTQKLFARLMGAIIEPLYSRVSTFSQEELNAFQEDKPIARPRPSNKVAMEKLTVLHLYCFNPTATSFGSKKFYYFYTEWNTRLPEVSLGDDLIKVSQEFLKFLGVFLATDASLFQKICDIVVFDLKRDASDENKDKWFAYFRNFILPAICAIEENPIPVDKAFEILKFFSPEERFNLYGEHYQVIAKNNPHVKMHCGKAEKETKAVLKRLSKENVDQMMRRLAKISYSNPLHCFLTILQQIESYDNLNSLVVETAGFFSEYGWDNLTLAILMRLTAPGRSNIQMDGLNDRQWIQSLASFIGKLCRRYPDLVDLSTIVLYLLKSFHNNEIAGLIVLKEILGCMGGIESITNLTPLQINMINCGSCMGKIVYRTIGDTRYESDKSGTIMCKTLFNLDAVNELLVLLCRTNKNIVSGDEYSHLKVLSNKNDDVDTVTRLLCTLVSFFGHQDSSSHLLPIALLVQRFEVPIPWAFEIWRQYLHEKTLATTQSSLESAFPETFSAISSSLFANFWKLSLSDINYSSVLYDSELEKLQANLASLQENISFSRRDKEVPKSAVDELVASLARVEKFIAEIPAQKTDHEQKDKKVVDLIKNINSSWFPETDSKSAIAKMVEVCILPRAVHSSFDALFSAKFLFFLHKLNTPNYSVLTALSILFSRRVLFGTLFTCTATEAENLGLFVAEILMTLNLWTNEEGFKQQVEQSPFTDESSKPVSFSEYRSAVFKFHSNILEDVTEALLVVDYMSRRNAITFLKNLLGVYPTVEDHCEALLKLIEATSKQEKRDDLKLSLSALIGHVKSRQKTWVHIWDFVDLSDEEKEASMARRKKITDKQHRAAEKLRKAQEEIRQAELKKEREELARIEKERQEKIERERIAQNQQAAVHALNYSDSAPKTERSLIRGYESVRGRYDQYSTKAAPKDAPAASSKDFKKSLKPTGAGEESHDTTKEDALKLKISAPAKELETKRPDSRQSNARERFQSGLGGSASASASASSKATAPAKPVSAKSTVTPSGPSGSSGSSVSGPSGASGPSRSSTPSGPSGGRSGSNSARASSSQSEAKLSDRSVASAPKAGSNARTAQDSKPPQRPALSTNSRSGLGYNQSKPQTAPVPAPPAPPAETAKTRAAAETSATSKLAPSSNTKRAPLPPQQPPRDSRSGYRRNDGYCRGDGYSRNDRGSRLSHSYQSGSSTPLPPPTLPPPLRDGRNDKRRRDQRDNDRKRPRY